MKQAKKLHSSYIETEAPYSTSKRCAVMWVRDFKIPYAKHTHIYIYINTLPKVFLFFHNFILNGSGFWFSQNENPSLRIREKSKKNACVESHVLLTSPPQGSNAEVARSNVGRKGINSHVPGCLGNPMANSNLCLEKPCKSTSKTPQCTWLPILLWR